MNLLNLNIFPENYIDQIMAVLNNILQSFCRITVSTRACTGAKKISTSAISLCCPPIAIRASISRTTACYPKFVPFMGLSELPCKHKLNPLAVGINNIDDINKISLRLPGLNKPEAIICPVPLAYYGHTPLEKNLPPTINWEKLDPSFGAEIREPASINANLEKLAARLIKIRRKKMKKHKLKKLRKRMFFVWAKVRQRREARKEKHFQNAQLARIQNADDFNAEEWVNEYLRKSTTDPETLIVRKEKLPRPTKYVF